MGLVASSSTQLNKPDIGAIEAKIRADNANMRELHTGHNVRVANHITDSLDRRIWTITTAGTCTSIPAPIIYGAWDYSAVFDQPGKFERVANTIDPRLKFDVDTYSNTIKVCLMDKTD